MMDLFHVLHRQDLVNYASKPLSMRKIVISHYQHLLYMLALDIVLVKKVKSFDELNEKNNTLCFCKHKGQYDAWFQNTICCRKSIHKQCLLLYQKTMVCAHFATRWYKTKCYLHKHQCIQQQEYEKNQLSNTGRDKPSKQQRW